MKIINGKYKGRTLFGHHLEKTRPTMDRVKESLFAMIQFNLEDSVVLDLFAGSGNLGIEALSMNAQKCFLVDLNQKAVSVIKKNLEKLGISRNKVQILNLDYRRALDIIKKEKQKFDVIFLDPPYQTNYITKSIELITQYDLLNKGGLMICESDDLEKVIYSNYYKELKTKKYGDKYIVILKRVL